MHVTNYQSAAVYKSRDLTSHLPSVLLNKFLEFNARLVLIFTFLLMNTQFITIHLMPIRQRETCLPVRLFIWCKVMLPYILTLFLTLWSIQKLSWMFCKATLKCRYPQVDECKHRIHKELSLQNTAIHQTWKAYPLKLLFYKRTSIPQILGLTLNKMCWIAVNVKDKLPVFR